MVGATLGNRGPTVEIVCTGVWTIAREIFQIKKKKEL
jgi:hypothetical protein